MQKDISALLVGIQKGEKKFIDVVDFIDNRYKFTPVAFNNGELHNNKGQNAGSCRVLAFAKLQNLSVLDALQLFAEHYQAVAANPKSTDHQNIRQFKKYGFKGLVFDGEPLTSHKAAAFKKQK